MIKLENYWDQFEQSNARLLAVINSIDKGFFERIRNFEYCDIDDDFLGFCFIYEQLSKIIPKDRVVIDFGCAYATQAAFFKEHKKYIGVDVFDSPRLVTENSTYYKMTTEKWVEEINPNYVDDVKFCICSYVPGDSSKIVRENFDDVFTFYPKRNDSGKLKGSF